ncbi:GNAT family N-acetyltransferase [Rhabdaerophilum sp. SD176]|uniref:GNAT family N-acetyltransferase n=1 Tax=Rhabdaerophilum sp. SD176 TaxID=2983548 RepID=UPI0024DFA688|nr:GNAT family N-acetyltransferase [Rhabdaerophilum sp. SD176]
MTFSVSAPSNVAAEATDEFAVAGVLDVDAIGFRNFREVEALLEGLEGSTFQSRLWLSSWFDVFGSRPGIENFLVLVRDAGGAILMALPLIRRNVGNIRMLECPDLGVSDYAAPMLRRSSVNRLPRGDALWELIRPALPAADLLHVCRIAPVVGGMANPIHGHHASRRNRLSGWVLSLPTCWNTYFASLSPKKREKLKKMGRKFNRVPGAERRMVESVTEGLGVLADLERLQSVRIEKKGLDYCLDEPAIRDFYRRLIERGLPAGKVQMAVLTVDGKTVAANFAVKAGSELVYLRVANEFGPWANYALGLVVTELAIAEAQKRGIRTFDFTMGNYDYKRRFGAVEMPLDDLVLPLSWRGWPAAGAWHLRHWASRSSWLRRMFGRHDHERTACPRHADESAGDAA